MIIHQKYSTIIKEGGLDVRVSDQAFWYARVELC